MDDSEDEDDKRDDLEPEVVTELDKLNEDIKNKETEDLLDIDENVDIDSDDELLMV